MGLPVPGYYCHFQSFLLASHAPPPPSTARALSISLFLASALELLEVLKKNNQTRS